MLTNLKMYVKQPEDIGALMYEIVYHLWDDVDLQVTCRPRVPDTFTERRFNSWGQFPNLLWNLTQESLAKHRE